MRSGCLLANVVTLDPLRRPMAPRGPARRLRRRCECDNSREKGRSEPSAALSPPRRRSMDRSFTSCRCSPIGVFPRAYRRRLSRRQDLRALHRSRLSAFPMAGNPILASGVSGSGPVAGTVQLGTGIGAEIDLMLFVISCYFGMGFFAAADGFTFAFLLIGSAVSASTLGWIFHIGQSCTPGFVPFEILLATAGVLTMTSGHIAIQPRAKAEGKVSDVRGYWLLKVRLLYPRRPELSVLNPEGRSKAGRFRARSNIGHRQKLASRSAKPPTASCISLSREPAAHSRGRRPLTPCQSRN